MVIERLPLKRPGCNSLGLFLDIPAMNIRFWKMHGAGNDFIIMDDRVMRFPLSDRLWIRQICSLHTGIGAEGLILIQPSDKASFRMRFFNPDGLEAEMCGNGVRCAARFANDLGIVEKKMAIQTIAGILQASITTNGVQVTMPPPSGIRLNFPVQAAGQCVVCNFVNTGVPHVVVEAEDPDQVNLQFMGPLLRRHEAFAPHGANVNYMRVTGVHSLKARTYERGVESETLACGTGVTACVLVAALMNKVISPVSVKCRSGDVLEVDFQRNADNFENVSLSGPAVPVFQGEITYP